LLVAAYHPEKVAGAEQIRAEFAARMPVKPITSLADDNPGVDISAFGGGVTPQHMTCYGVVANGVNPTDHVIDYTQEDFTENTTPMTLVSTWQARARSFAV